MENLPTNPALASYHHAIKRADESYGACKGLYVRAESTLDKLSESIGNKQEGVEEILAELGPLEIDIAEAYKSFETFQHMIEAGFGSIDEMLSHEQRMQAVAESERVGRQLSEVEGLLVQQESRLLSYAQHLGRQIPTFKNYLKAVDKEHKEFYSKMLKVAEKVEQKANMGEFIG